MNSFEIYLPEVGYNFPMVFVKGTGDTTYLFGASEKTEIHVNDFFMSKFQVTQKLWEYIMGNNPSHFNGQDRPVETVSFNGIS